MITDRDNPKIDLLGDLVSICKDAGKISNTFGIASIFNVMAQVGMATLNILREQHIQIQELQRTVKALSGTSPPAPQPRNG